MLDIYTFLILHFHFRKYHDVLIKKREVLKDFKNLVNDHKLRVYWDSWYKCGGWKGVGNELRLTLPNQVRNYDNEIIVQRRPALTIPKDRHHPELDWDTVVLYIPNLIEELHPPQYWTDKNFLEKFSIKLRKIGEKLLENWVGMCKFIRIGYMLLGCLE